MMNKGLCFMKKIVYYASVLAIAAGCAKEIENNTIPAEGSYKLVAEIAESTKATIDDATGSMTWSVGDKISVLSDDMVNSEFTLIGSEPTKVGTFTGDFTGTPVYAVYPYNENNLALGTDVEINLPSSYEYDGVTTHAPMVATVTATSELNAGTAVFEHVAGLIKVTYENVPSTAKKFKFTATKNITGSFSVVDNKISAVDGTLDKNVVTYEFSSTSSTMSFYIPAPCGEYGFSIGLYDKDDNKIAKSGKKVTSTTIACGEYYCAPFITLESNIVTLTENFISNGATANTYDCSSSFSTATNQTDWNYVWTPSGSGTVFKNGIKLGAKSSIGTVSNASMLNGIPAGTQVTIKVYAAVWNTDGGKITLTYNGSAETKDTSNDAITNTGKEYSALDFSSSTDFNITIVSGVTDYSVASSSKRLLVDKIEVVFTETNSGTFVNVPSFSIEEGDYSEPQNLSLSTSVENGTIYYTTDGTDPSSSQTAIVYSDPISISTTMTINAVVKDANANFSDVVSNTYTIETSIANTAATAYTTSQAKNLIDSGSSQLSSTSVFVQGTVSKVEKYNDTYGSITYWLDNDSFEVYSGLNNNGEKFSSINDIAVGADVIVYGIIKKYSSTYEFDKENWLVSYTAPVAAKQNASILCTYKTSLYVGDSDSYSVTYNGDGVVSVSSSNSEVATASISENTITITSIAAGNVTITISSSETETFNAATKNYQLIVKDPASVPFSFDFGKSDIDNTPGMSQSGLGTDYSSSPKLKFDSTNDNVIICIGSSASTLSYTIKGNSFSNGTFDVMVSSDGTDYSNLASYTTLGSAKNETKSLGSSVRYIKFIYTNKSSGNVALGNISISN